MSTKNTVISALFLSIFMTIGINVAFSSTLLAGEEGMSMAKLLSAAILGFGLLGLIAYAIKAFFGYRNEFDL